MSFEIISLTYDTGTKLQKGITQSIPSPDPIKRQSILYPTTYRIGLQLNILAKNQDDALQILEQILPYFQPEYTVTVKEVENNFKSDVPFVLQAVTLTDDYEGDFMSRRSIIYTLEFEAKVRFYGPIGAKNVIRTSGATLSDPGMTSAGLPYVSQSFTISPANANEDENYEIIGTYESIATPDSVKLFFDDLTGGTLSVGDTVEGTTSMVSGKVSEVGIGYIIVAYPDGNFVAGETVTNGAGISFTIKNLEPIYRTITSFGLLT